MKRLLTGFKPTGELTIGNYIGVIKQILEYQKEYETYVFVADLHSLTVDNNVEDLKRNIKDFAALFVATGVSNNNSVLYVQSDCPYITAVSWLLECSTYYGEMSRMIQFKAKSKNNDNFTVGLFTYPALMASDILVVDSEIVPVGIDQKQHVELTRDVAIRFNNKYGNTFVIPEAKTNDVGIKIMDLQDPTKKMSKTEESKKGVISLLDSLEDARKKIMGATTDSESIIKYDEKNKPGISNLLNIYSGLTDIPIRDIENKYKGSNYGEFKKALADIVVSFLDDLQTKYKYIIENNEVDYILDTGSKKVNEMAKQKYETMRNKMGIIR